MNRRVFSLLSIGMLAACNSSGAVALSTPAPSATPQSDAPLRASVARLADAWNAGNGDAWAAEFWPDGSLVNILGVYVAGATAIAAVHNAILSGPFKGSTLAASIRDVRFLGTAGAIVEADIDVTNFRGLPPGAVATSPGLLVTRYIFIFENRDGVWKIEASQNTAVLPAPSPSPSPSPSAS